MARTRDDSRLDPRTREILGSKLNDANLEKLLTLENPKLHRFVAEAIERCEPDSVFVCTDDPDDVAYVRQQAIDRGEEKPPDGLEHLVGGRTRRHEDRRRSRRSPACRRERPR